MWRRAPILLLATACQPTTDEPAAESLPLGLPTTPEGETWAGAAVIDLTPTIRETFTDANDNHLFDGCFDDPTGTGDGCGGEAFDDADGDGRFDAVFIGGFDPLRPANTVEAEVTARSWVIADGGEYLALVVLDFVGLASPRIDAALDLLEDEGVDRDRVMVTSTHNHQGPDTMGLWGNPEACLLPGSAGCVPGFDEAYQQRVSETIAQVVRDAAEAAQRVDLSIGSVRMRDRSPLFNGSVWGGHNPVAKMHGMVNDIRDPVVVSDQLIAMQATTPDDEVVFTFTSWSGHPEVRGGDNNAITADWVGVHREILEAHFGGIAIHVPESLGGMQSALGGQLPLVTEDGEHVWDLCTADDVAEPVTQACEGLAAGDPKQHDDGTPVPVWIPDDSWEYVVSHGWHIAEAAIDVLEDDPHSMSAVPLRGAAVDAWVPVRNLAYNVLGPQGIFDLPLDEGTFDPEVCPEAVEVQLGCIPFRVYRAQIGDLGIASAPGELLPELAWGLPEDDPQWVLEAADASARGPGSTYFPQHDPDCDDVSFEQCRDTDQVGDCDCLSLHAVPYRISDDAAHHPVLDDLDTDFRMAMSMTSTYLSYIVPEPSVNRSVSLLSDRDGDHYEDTVTVAWDFARLYLDAWNRLNEDW